jgi:hypothetical protein
MSTFSVQCYYSPLNVYPFGIVDCSTEPSQLTAMMFYEGTICFFTFFNREQT